MDMWWHALISTIITILLWPIVGPWALLAIAGGVLIDGDHVVWYWFRTGRFSLKETWIYSKKVGNECNLEEYETAVLPLHTFDFFIATMIVSLFFFPGFAFVIGFMAHMLMDLIHSLHWARKPVFLNMFSKSILLFLIDWVLGDRRGIRRNLS